MIRADLATLLARELDAMEIAYHPSAAPNLPSASFGYSEARGPELAVGAIIKHGALVMTVPVPSLVVGLPNVSALSGLNQAWGTGSAQYVETSGCYQTTAGYPIFARRSHSTLLRRLLGGIYTVGVLIRLVDTPDWETLSEIATGLREGWPDSDVSSAMERVSAALHAMGYSGSVTTSGGLCQRFHTPDGLQFTLAFSPCEGLIRVETVADVWTAHDALTLGSLNNGLPVGSVVLGPSNRAVHVWDFSPDDLEISERLVGWIIEVAAHVAIAQRSLAARIGERDGW
ncbi:hypothetical protein [Paraburkholderia sp. 32]|uniref:hypothetical protein n=1 Tax=Paraburkholderia sp. 32 TaxID=2991057 RepID=UPI003D19EEAB